MPCNFDHSYELPDRARVVIQPEDHTESTTTPVIAIADTTDASGAAGTNGNSTAAATIEAAGSSETTGTATSTSAATGSGAGPTDITSNGSTVDPLPPQENPLDITSKEPERELPPSGGGGNKKANIPDIVMRIHGRELQAQNGNWYPSPFGTKVEWEMGPGVDPPVKFHLYRDDELVQEIDAENKDKWDYEELYVIPVMEYRYQVFGLDANNNEVAKSPLRNYLVPHTGQNYNLLTKMAVLPLHFTDYDGDPVDLDAMTEMIDTADDSVRKFFNENSFGLVDFTLDTFPEASMAHPSTEYYYIEDGQIHWEKSKISAEAAAILGDPQYNYDDYDVWIVPVNGYGGSGASGGRIQTFPAIKIDREGVVHEVAHFLGTNHGYTWQGPDELVGPSVNNLYEGGYTVTKYGDVFSPTGVSIRHFTAYDKEVFGWISQNKSPVVTEPGLYTLASVSVPGNTYQQLKINFPGVSKKIFYTIEYRTPTGFDAVPIGGGQAGEWLKQGKVIDAGQPFHCVMIRLRWDRPSSMQENFTQTGTYQPITVITEDNPFVDVHRNISVSINAFWPNNQVQLLIEGDLG